MPIATNDTSTLIHKDLKTLPGAFVKLRRLSYGEKLYRRAMTSNFAIKAGKGKDFEGEMKMVNEKATTFDFQTCVVEHNLEKANPVGEGAVPLDFANVNDIKSLDPRVGEEIDMYLSEINNFEEDDEGN